MLSKVTLILAVQFGLPFAAAICRELVRTHPRSGWRRLSLGVASVILIAIPWWVYMFVSGTSPFGNAESVDWYVIVFVFSFGLVPLFVAAVFYLVVSTFIEPLVSLACRKGIATQSNQASESSLTNDMRAFLPSQNLGESNIHKS